MSPTTGFSARSGRGESEWPQVHGCTTGSQSLLAMAWSAMSDPYVPEGILRQFQATERVRHRASCGRMASGRAVARG